MVSIAKAKKCERSVANVVFVEACYKHVRN